MSTDFLKVSEAFSNQAPVFDEISTQNKLSDYLRVIFRNEVLFQLRPKSYILELNCGTGLDAVFFAKHGHRILATDNAPGMIEQIGRKIIENGFEDQLQAELLSFHNLNQLEGKKFDHIISNFGGLNCTDDLKDVLLQLPDLLNDRGKITLVVMPKLSPWEIIQVFRFKFKTAFRRFGKNSSAQIEGVRFQCYYYSPRYIIKTLKNEFDLITLKGIFITVPPEYYKNFVENYPKLFSLLSKLDNAICRFFPFTYCCDHYLITLQKKP